MIDLAAGFLSSGDKLPAGPRMGICTSSGGAGVWMADACAAAGLEVPVLDDATRKAIDVHLPSYGTSQNPVDSTAQGVHKLGYAEFARLVGQSPLIDGVIVVVTARRSAFLENDLPKLQALGRDSKKPVFMWTYTLPSDRSVEILNEAGFPLFTGALGCARTMQAMVEYRTLRERLLRPADTVSIPAAGPRGRPRHAGNVRAGTMRMACAAGAGGLWHRRQRGGTARPFGGRGGSRGPRHGAAGGAESAVRRHPAQDRSRRRGAQYFRRRCARRLRARARRRASATRRTRASTACWCSRWRRPDAKSSSASAAIRSGARC